MNTKSKKLSIEEELELLKEEVQTLKAIIDEATQEPLEDDEIDHNIEPAEELEFKAYFYCKRCGISMGHGIATLHRCLRCDTPIVDSREKHDNNLEL